MIQKTREAKSTRTAEVDETDDTALKAAQEAGKAALEGVTDEDIDKMLTDIDDVLEENAQEFVEAFVQKGGQ